MSDFPQGVRYWGLRSLPTYVRVWTMTDPDTDTEWVAPGRAARVLVCSTKTIGRLADEGKLRSYRTEGGQRRVALNDVKARRDELVAELAAS